MSRPFCKSIEDAEKSWCPFARYGESNLAGYHTSNVGAKCIGPECMAWRFVDTYIKNPDPHGMLELVPSGDTHGYCGLAGPP
jgi:hypothetical protein